MNIKLFYKSDEPRMIKYENNVSSISTRSIINSERFIRAVMPEEVSTDKVFMKRLFSSAERFIKYNDVFDIVGSEDAV